MPKSRIWGRWSKVSDISRFYVKEVVGTCAHCFGFSVVDFVGTEQIFLEENYRTTGAILGAALAIVRQGTLS